MKSSILATLTLAVIAIGTSSPVIADPTYPEAGYDVYEVPLLWQNMGKKGTPSKLFEFNENKQAAKELERDEVFFIDLPEAPQTGKLYVRLIINGNAQEDISEAPVIQIYGATLSYALVQTNESDSQALIKAAYVFVEAEESTGIWVKKNETRLSRGKPDADELRKQRSQERFLTTHQFVLEIDFDDQTWKPLLQRDDVSYPLLKGKGKKLVLFRKQKDDEMYISNLVFSETRYSRVGGPKRPNDMSKEDWEEKLRQENEGRMQGMAAEIRRRREERKNSQE